MDLNTYIKQNQLNPNPVLLSQLGASQELIDYLLYTPENTNFGMLSSIGGGSGGSAVVGEAVVGTAVI